MSYKNEYKKCLGKIKILLSEINELLNFLREGIEKLKVLINEQICKFEKNEIPKLATAHIKIALFIRYSIEVLIHTIVIFNKKYVKIEKMNEILKSL